MIKGRRRPELFVLENLLYTTVRIETYNDEGYTDGVGTGFFYQYITTGEGNYTEYTDVLVTNKHVIERAASGSLTFHLGPVVDNIPTGGIHKIRIDDFENQFILHPDPEVDLCGIKLSKYLRDVEEITGAHVHYQAFVEYHIPEDDELKKMFPIEDVYMVGYPIGLWDEINHLPITRRGVTASHPAFDFNGEPRGLIDIATFPGSSGSPVILFQNSDKTVNGKTSVKFHLLGILESSAVLDAEGELIQKEVPTKKITVPTTQMMIHIGYYIKAKELLVLGEIIEES